MAIGLVIQRRTQRSHWFSVIARARQHRVELVFDLVKGLTVFEDVPKSQVMNLCAYASVQTFSQQSSIFSKGDDTSNLVFMVLNGSVALQQVVPASLLNGSIATGAMAHSNSIMPSTDAKVTIQIMDTGDIFGDFEMYHQATKRYINAVSASPWTRLVLIPQDDFRLFWPQQTRLNDKLSLLKASLQNVHDFDSEQLCSMYYGAIYQAFSRNEGKIVNLRVSNCSCVGLITCSCELSHVRVIESSWKPAFHSTRVVRCAQLDQLAEDPAKTNRTQRHRAEFSHKGVARLTNRDAGKRIHSVYSKTRR